MDTYKENSSSAQFNTDRILSELKHYLPSQQALKDFIHHNSLHAFQHMKFYDAIFKASNIFGYHVHLELNEYRELYATGRIKEEIIINIISKKNKNIDVWLEKMIHVHYNIIKHPRIGQIRKLWKDVYKIDLDGLVHPRLFRILCVFLDQGVAIDRFPIQNKSFIESIKELEQKSLVSFFKTKAIRELFTNGSYSIESLLKEIVGDSQYFEQYLFDSHFAHNGWSGFVSSVEDNPQTLLDKKIITFKELVEFELLIELDTITAILGDSRKPLANFIKEKPTLLFEDVNKSEFSEVIELWQDAFEWSYYDTVLKGIQVFNKKRNELDKEDTLQKSFQAIFCIDERECSLRRHIEATDPNCETMGAPGFFGVEFYFQQHDSKFYDKLCPAPVTPKYLIKEFSTTAERKNELLYSRDSHGMMTGIAYSLVFGFWAFIKTINTLFKPMMSPAISNAFGHMHKYAKLSIENKDPKDIENGLQIGYTNDEMATRAEGFLRGIGLIKNFAPIIYLVSHGSSSANNPHHGAHDCGACSGRPGAVNARVQAFILNNKKVREILSTKGILIPNDTCFIGSMHDTAADIIDYYDEDVLINSVKIEHVKNKHKFEIALNLNAKERSRRFASIDTKQDLNQIRQAIQKRSVSLFEPRPELGHGTNTLAIVGRRKTSKGLFLDRRAFLNSYDYTTDPSGEILSNVMRPIGLVCGGINLEYYFSRVDNLRMGAGTKLPHNVMGLFGVANSSDGDLRPGLPWQMIEVHDPVRLLVIVEHRPEIVLKAINSSPDVFEWYKNEWVHIIAMNPFDQKFYLFKDGAFEHYEPITKSEEISYIKNMEEFLESSNEMETNHITHATKENLPVYLLNQ
jgi:uncharacterized protein YbcC (UPF0753/DUF2309 family)